MKQYKRNFIVLVGIVLAAYTSTQAQDWTEGTFTLWHSFGSQGTGDGQFQQADGIAVDENGLIYISDYALHRIQVFKADGTFVRKWGSQGSGTNQFLNPRGLDIGADGNLYVCDWGNHRICVYQPDGTFVRQWGSYGAADGQFNNPYRIFVSQDGLVYVADFHNCRVQVFGINGTFKRKIAVVSSAGANQYPYAVVANQDGEVFVAQGKVSFIYSDYQYPYITKYDETGCRGTSWMANPNSFYNDRTSVGGMDMSPQGNLVYGTKYYLYPSSDLGTCNSESIRDQNGGSVYSLQGYRCLDIKTVPNGALVQLCGVYTVQVNCWLKRVLPDYSEQFGSWAKIENVQQRAGYPYLDIDFRVNSDNGRTNATVAMCAFLNGTINLANLIPMRTFVDGTETNLGADAELSTNILKVTWNMAADWSADSGNIQVQAFAQEGPYYLPFNFLTIPAGGGVSSPFEICRTPVTSDDLKAAWLFLVASNDPEVELVSGKVYGTGGSYDGVELANDTSTTTSGKNFLWERMSLRDPTTTELAWAKEATIPGIQQWSPRVTVGGRPSKINEFGLDTGATTGFWAVKQ